MSAATLTIDPEERGTLHWLMARRLFILGQDPPALARSEGISLDQLAQEFAEDLQLMADLGWQVDDNRKAIDLAMPADNLAKALRRLRRDARRAPCEKRDEREREKSDAADWERFRPAVAVCEKLLARLDSPVSEEEPDSTGADCPLSAAGREITPYTSLSEGFILAAVERAACHQRSDEVSVVVVVEHLGFEPTRGSVGLLRLRLETLHGSGWLTRTQRDDRENWGLTPAGREELAKCREGGTLGDLPESPQHRVWREAQVKAVLRIEGFRREMSELWEETDQLLNRWKPVLSQEWFSLSERFRVASWRLGSASHCLEEWVEPDDARPDVDENPGPAPGRRAVAVWDLDSIEIGGSA
jgi:hypothetical protein